MGYLWVCPRMVVSTSVSAYLGLRVQYSLMVRISGIVNGYPNKNYQKWKDGIIILFTLSFGKIRHLPLWSHISLVNIYCFNIASYLPKQITFRSTSFILTLNHFPKFIFHHFRLQYLETMVAFRHDTLPNKQLHWSFQRGCIPCNDSLIL